ncbi:hypothetical protein [Ottowia testudinis]|uniref:Uncharacterized protein n=1 Tax=Ottowia testudinis TaxID=2816950 RepID=A0A975CDL6_9BURK|nr:hypothetical protein [Ottowia testudinis]QTD43917.1 hypothetical protein J1M35_12265 [Ottowia testudinis]
MKTLQSPSRAAAVLAQLLERLDASRRPVDAHQYRAVVSRLSGMLADPEVDWQPLLAESPAAATLYENLNYADAGLCRAPLEAATRAEMAARALIEAARAKPAPGKASPDAAPAA